MVKEQDFDLLLSDINMPGMKGFDLLNQVRSVKPELKTALMTAYEVRDYLRLARDHDIGNIIAKTTPFNYGEMSLLIRNILSENVFGLDKYIQGPIQSENINCPADMERTIEKVICDIPEQSHKHSFIQALGKSS